MRRLITAPALLACFVLAGPAEARVEQKSVTKSQGRGPGLLDGRAHAGGHAGRAAVRGSRGEGREAALPWTSEEITTPYTQQPTSTHGKVFFTLGGNDYVCSGTRC